MTDQKLPKVLVTSTEYPDVGMEILRNKCEIIQISTNGFEDKVKTREEIEKLIAGVEGIIWSSSVRLDSDLINKAGSQLKVVASMSAGVDHIDKDELKARNIILTNTPDVLNAAVADVAILLMVGTARRLPERIEEVKSGNWEIGPQRMLGLDIKGSTVGIVGLGGIGQMIVNRLKGFELKTILYCGHKEKPEAAELGAEFVPFDDLLTRSDFIFICCSLNETSTNLMDANAFSKMQKTAILINVSRGGVIDQEALYNALNTKQIYAAGLDVTTPEPLPKEHPLNSLSNCFITPHLGSATRQTRYDMAQLSALNLILGLQGQNPLTPVF
ncbi:glyoxylate reductase/hydroxypyruvate reductase-like [Arctopsyche grandis]|uniref:glyoxylate reductase/hydroxypyruvate reductase-like n=1 Tax=Arctopsyche grandis TaxID=121162 RepID=UPI00406D991C